VNGEIIFFELLRDTPMADPKNIEPPEARAKSWNSWRSGPENANLRPGFRIAELNRAHLIETILTEADLRDASLSGTKLGDMNLSGQT
jgi:hypothetical protein